MTDNELMKALGLCATLDEVKCKECPCRDICNECNGTLAKMVFDQINRQKAEIERLQKENTAMRIQARKNRNKRDKSSKAIRKFKKRLKSYILGTDKYSWGKPLNQDDWFEIKIGTFFRAIDDIAKETAGDE